MLIVHIGLPKTATTFLQYRIFKPAFGPGFVHRASGEFAEKLCREFRRLGSTAGPAGTHRQRIRALLKRGRHAGAPAILVTDENISVHWRHVWDGAGIGPARLAERFARLRRDLADLYPALRVIVGIRRQDQWLASRYAESSKNHPEFGQADFEERMAGIAAAARLEGALAWLDYAAVRAGFGEALGPDNVLIAPMERLGREPRALLAEMSAFVGADLLACPEHPAAAEDPKPNRLSAAENVWQLRRDGSELRLPEALQAALRARFGATNRTLAAAVPLGYEP
jgi:hypothetical protein